MQRVHLVVVRLCSMRTAAVAVRGLHRDCSQRCRVCTAQGAVRARAPPSSAFLLGNNLKMPYALRTRKPPLNDPLLTACHDALPPDILEYILLLRVAMPPPMWRYLARYRHIGRAT